MENADTEKLRRELEPLEYYISYNEADIEAINLEITKMKARKAQP